jgi:hypothetical protein
LALGRLLPSLFQIWRSLAAFLPASSATVLTMNQNPKETDWRSWIAGNKHTNFQSGDESHSIRLMIPL